MSSSDPDASSTRAWVVEPSAFSKRVNNPIRKIVDNIKKPETPGKELISLSLGDPTVFGNLKTTSVLTDALVEALHSFKHNGYVHSAGDLRARTALASHYSYPEAPLTPEHVVIASGCSGALDIVISGMLNAGDNILLPSPGFPLYQTLAETYGAECRYYPLNPETGWEADVAAMEALIDGRTRAILINNPSNPCGSVFSEAHVRDILAVAERHRLPVIADEIYGDMVFAGHRFHPAASLSTTVPVIAVGGIAKQFLVPGWRVGWVLVYGRHGELEELRQAFFRLSQLILGANTLVQSALPAILTPAADSDAARELTRFKADVLAQLEDHAQFTVEALSGLEGLTVVVPQGAMYVMVRVDVDLLADVADDVEFCSKLLAEESVVALPGQCFGVRNFVRVVFTAPKDKLEVAYARIRDFCARHRKSGAP